MSSSDVRRSASGARQGGDDYQHLVAWNRILRSRLPGRPALRAVELEALDAGNVDDVVVHYVGAPSEYSQVKYAVDLSSPLSSDYLLQRSGRGTSVLQKFLDSYRQLGGAGTELRLITNRAPDPTDPALSSIDGRTGLLVPAFETASSGSALGRLRFTWCSHLGCETEELLALLSHLEFRIGRQYAAEEETAGDYMGAAGFRNDITAIRLGIDRVRRWVLEGRRQLTASEVDEGIDQLELAASEPAAILHIQALDRDPMAQEATEVLDWVPLFAGDTAAARRETLRSDAYTAVMEPELEAAAARLIGAGYHRVLVRGPMRLATSFRVGTALPRVRNMTLVRRQGGEYWSTDASPTGLVGQLVSTDTPVGSGADVALAVGITAAPTEDVLRFLNKSGLPVGLLRTVSLGGGPDDTAVRGDGHAVAIAQAIRETARELVRDRNGATIHLFLACPGGLALILGNRWNRVAPTVVYEDLIGTYQRAFHVSA